ncbi:MAG TPA: B12-binding domain-containing protein [Solirubrobacteraceae bacterium]|nr:B12-binding domain-containing protein [Solirubrobacteraceae bacterium]
MGCQESDAEQLLADLGRAYARALLAGDEIGAELAVRDAIDARLTTAQIDEEIIAPALWLVGRLWARGEISVADEHLATEISLRVLALQREAVRTVSERAGRKALLAAPMGELHTVALQMNANLLRDAGYTVLMLGPDVPPGALAEAAVRHEPSVICLTATMPDVSDRVMLAIREVERGWPGAGWVLGGRGLSVRLRPQPGIHVCRRVSEVVEAADAVLKRADLN